MKIPFAFVKPNGPPPLDLATLNWELFFHGADYNGSNSWPGRASAGPSNTYTAAAAGGPSTSTQNGIQTLLFNGTTADLVVNGLPAPTGNWSFVCVYKFDPTGAPNDGPGTSYNNEALIGDDGGNRFIQTVRSGHVQTHVYSGGHKGQEAPATDNAWQIMFAKGDGTSIYVQEVITGGGWVSTLAGYSLAGVALTIGKATNVSVFYKGQMAMLGLAHSVFSDSLFDQIKTSLRSEWSI